MKIQQYTSNLRNEQVRPVPRPGSMCSIRDHYFSSQTFYIRHVLHLCVYALAGHLTSVDCYAKKQWRLTGVGERVGGGVGGASCMCLAK
jgi:hypothetical protein